MNASGWVCHTGFMKYSQQITVFGATGRVGRIVVELLLERGYNVIAAVHGHNSLSRHDHMVTRVVDIYDMASVAEALRGSSVVISALGSWGTKRKDILTVGMTNIIPAMEKMNIRRIVSLTGADARATNDRLGLIHRLTHLGLGIVAAKILRDGERHIELLESSPLQYTVIRSPIMCSRDKVGYGVLSLHRPLPWQQISYQYVAEAMVRSIESDEWVRQAPYIS